MLVMGFVEADFHAVLVRLVGVLRFDAVVYCLDARKRMLG